jgi:transcriptional regulator with PAS, ATPase and Fis domain
MKDLLAVLSQAAAARLPVLLYGESGVGKHFLADWALSQAAGKALVFANVDDLDAAGQLNALTSLKVQVKAESQAGPFTVATARTSLESAVGEGTFRQDLYYRLAGCPLYVPPLRNRREDLLPLAKTFLAKWTKQLGEKEALEEAVTFTDDAVQLLLEYRWPGNVRELENAVLRACAVTGTRNQIRARDLGIKVPKNGAALGEVPLDLDDTEDDLRGAVRRFKRAYVTRALDKTGWNQTKAAKNLRIQRSYLSRLLNELEIRS